tara:strand:- start:216 stop:761 length:546 start_codon:yes stop_codon:yes gene_type:complete
MNMTNIEGIEKSSEGIQLMTPEKRFDMLFREMYNISMENNWGDPFSYAVSREIQIANILGHKKADTYSGADGIDEDGDCEYKSTIGEKLQGAYNGISVQDSWEKQKEYLLKDKIGKYKNHYIVRFDGPEIVECWKMSGTVVLKTLLPKLKRQFFSDKKKKDPRLGATLTEKEIYSNGKRII